VRELKNASGVNPNLALHGRTCYEPLDSTHPDTQGTDRIIEVLTSPTPWAREMRQNSPFAGALDDDERMRVLAEFKSNDRSGK
jgi:hypothetical protein